MVQFSLKNWRSLIFIFFVAVLISHPAFAEQNMPFASTLETLKTAISGPFLKAASVIMIVVTCLMLAFGEWGDGFKRIITIVLWLSIAFAATSFIGVFGS
jgi:type IV secretory pathway VirB2 component (pilin)